MKSAIMKFAKIYALMCEGTIAIAFGLMAPVLIGSIGLAMDVSQAYLVRQRLNGAVDAAALAAAATSEDEGEIATRVIDFIKINYAPEEIGVLDVDNIHIDVSDNEVTVTASAIYPVSFMSIFGFDKITVSSGVVVARELKGLEVVLVLDNTGSLGASNMLSVRTASKNFVKILFDRVEEPEDIKIGVVPYAASVRVGRYGLGLYQNNVLDEDGNVVTSAGAADYGVPFVTLPPGVSYTGDHTATGWYGCVVEHEATNYNAGATHIANSRGQLWTTNGTNCSNSNNCRGHGWNPSLNNNDPYPDDTRDDWRGPWDIYVYGKYVTQGQQCSGSGYSSSRCSSCGGSNSTCNRTFCYCWRSQPNQSCPIASVLPLTSSRTTINAVLDSMDYGGSTYSNIGMAWGMRVLSPEEPFIEGADWEDEEWNKAIVLMTDGEMSPSSVYSAYGPAGNESTNITTLNNRLLEVCSWLKADPRNVIIYTVTFDHATSDISPSTKAIYRNCATTPDHYFDAPSQAQLISAFERISGALANLHLKK